MKPNFALILSLDGICLLHRACGSWNRLGEVAFEGDDFGATLADLREKAAEFEPDGLHCTLVLPNDQIKYISLPRADISEDDPQQSALDALAGATPYAVEDLVVDWSLAQDHLHIAAVARETLTEAENFISQHGFDPVCFVAAPGPDDFSGAPYFGVASGHDAGDPVERDSTPIRATGSAFMPKAVIATIPEPEPEPDPAQPGTADDTPDPNPPLGNAPHDQAPANEPVAAFASIRAHRDDLPDAAPKLAGAARFFAPEDANPPSVDKDPDTSRTPGEPDFSGVADAGLPYEPISEPEEPKPSVVAQAGPAPAAKPIGADINPPPISVRAPMDDRAPVVGKAPDTEKARMTVFGARNQRKSGAIPKWSWWAIAMIAMIPIIGLAALASMTFEDGLAGLFHSPNRVRIADIPEAADPPLGDLTAPDTYEGNATDLPTQETPIADAARETPVEDTGAGWEIAAVDQADIASVIPQVEQPETIPPAQEALALPEPVELTPDMARARYAATGIWQMAPVGAQAPSGENLENFHLAAIDSSVNRQGAIALPKPRTSDSRPLTLLSPPGPETEFNLDDRGLVIATKEGALSPDGILVYAGKPALTPPARPGITAQSTTTTTGGGATDPAILRQTRPRPRPDDLAEQHERSALGGRTLDELAKLRPKLRPQSAQEAAALAAAVDGNAIDAALSEAAQSGLSEQAITASLRPAPRPEGFSDSVAQIRATQQSQVTPGQPLDADAVAVLVPSIPTSASVARSATDKNAIKLRKINLIGVYGTPKSRRALVRLPNGRYRKVVIGDRLDGGKVAAIGDDELRYIKNGRNVVLKMPQG